MPSKFLSRDLELGGGELLQNGVVIVDSNGNIDAPVTTTDLTLTGSATVGTTLAVTGVSTLTGVVNAIGGVTATGGCTFSTGFVSSGASIIGAALTLGTNVTLSKEVSHTISVVDTTTADTAGAPLNIDGANGVGTGEGGAINITTGDGGTTGAGGDFNLDLGAGGATSGAGGTANLTAGSATAGNSAGGAFNVVSGDGFGTGDGGSVNIDAGDSGAGATGNGGDVNLTAGAATSTDGNGGTVTLSGGTGTGTGASGGVCLQGRVFGDQLAPHAATVDATLTAAQLLRNIITINQGAGATSAQQLPTGTDIDAALPASFGADNYFDVSVMNISVVDAEDATVTTNAGLTLVGSMDFPAHSAATISSSGILRFRKTAANTFSVYRIA